jgi:hypothetical protein
MQAEDDDFGPRRDPFLSDASHRQALRGWPALLAALTVAALLAGIAGALVMAPNPRGGAGGAPAGGAPAGGAGVPLAARLLDVTDMGPGWSLLGAVADPRAGADGFGGTSSFVVGCLTHPVDAGRRAEAEVELAAGAAQTTVVSEAAALLTPPGADAVYRAVAAEMTTCRRVAVRPVPLAGIGAAASAWAVTAPAGGEVVVAARTGAYAVLLAYGSPGRPDPAVAAAYARRAVAKLG